MFMMEDNTYRDLRERSLLQWLDEMEKHEDLAVRGGVRLCRDYLEHLHNENARLKEENALKNSYLRKMAATAVPRPKWLAIRRGEVEKPMMPSMA